MSTKTETNSSGEPLVHYDVLIIGAGPAGAGAATFLAHLDVINVLMISKANGTADTPRAHVTNTATMECFRDVGIEDDMINDGLLQRDLAEVRYADTLLGEEYARDRVFGTARRMENYHTMSPSNHLEIPQTYVEPILLKESTAHGITARFDTEFITLSQDADGVTTQLRDCLTGATFSVRSQFVIGADGGQSPVMEHLGIPMKVAPAGALATNVLFKCDLTELAHSRRALITHTYLAERPGPVWGPFGVFRAVKPWKEWMAIMFSTPSGEKERPTDSMYMDRVREFIGPSCPPTQLISISHWRVRETVASAYSLGRVHCAGDAVHRHPPANGLGSNTSIQDSYNLAWKIAYVLQGKAGLRLLDTYSAERQPVGVGMIKRANDGIRDHMKLHAALGFHQPGLSSEEAVEKAKATLKELKEAGERGKERRRIFREALEISDTELNAFGIEMNHFYESSAVWLQDEREEPVRPKDLLREHIPSTYPGSRLPHAWLSTPTPTHARISTHDLAGKGAFALFTGIGGSAWHSAAQAVSQRLGITINVFSIGYGQAHTDLYNEWAERRGVEDDGAVLVRPDRFVAWRSGVTLGEGAEEKLEGVMRRVLCL
ncbi:FAD binding domain-containing protein [Pterulicium gracile]|uniref:FAD binding domain-containing protein n=1 Tax=Pterulicium gracile TaxID=1884261 RepID=A0A5C3QHN4_9AGAR|nr:FAD binding domain-containing protein [Pterula gracilis]